MEDPIKKYLYWKKYVNRLLANEISTATRYMSRCIQVFPHEQDEKFLLNQISCVEKMVLEDPKKITSLPKVNGPTAVLLNGSFNHTLDVHEILETIRSQLSRSDRIFSVLYNPYLKGIYNLANRLGIRRGPLPCTFITRSSLEEMVKLAGFEIVRTRTIVYCPWFLFGIGTLINKILPIIPGVRLFSFAYLAILRPINSNAIEEKKKSLSIVIPARNEKGNIENALKRLPNLNRSVEILFVEGHSTDGTWEEILRVKELFKDHFKIVQLKQTGKGKNDAVRLGFQKATGELLTILDADLTMPPELLGRFLEAYDLGMGDFINGSRLVYPMEGNAMRFLNHLGNVFFAKALSLVLQTRISDSLCGTKLVSREDYQRIVKWRIDFGDFDPFGDFELLFPAAVLGMGVVTIPIHYRARNYGTTNISRFRHGLILLKMTLIGFFKIRLGEK